MPVGYKKIEKMIDDEIDALNELNEEQAQVLSDLCKRIYMTESNGMSISNAQKIDKIHDDIKSKADEIF